MDKKDKYIHPEPVPYASQLALLPFLAGVHGYLRADKSSGLRVAIHRAMTRERKTYLQQVCRDVGQTDVDPDSEVGRLWHVNYRIIGMAFSNAAISRTKQFPDEAALRKELEENWERSGETSSRPQLSWLAVPFLGKSGDPVLVLFADSCVFNFFAEDAHVKAVVNMCRGFCQLIDELEDDPFRRIRNFPLQRGKEVEGTRIAYSFQEVLTNWRLPKFERLDSFNYDAS
jgi:hypothetical protein